MPPPIPKRINISLNAILIFLGFLILALHGIRIEIVHRNIPPIPSKVEHTLDIKPQTNLWIHHTGQIKTPQY